MEHTFLGATRSYCLDGESKLFHVEQFSLRSSQRATRISCLES
jgi:hypothetical protein